MKLTHFVFIFAVILLQGCASAYKSDTSHSMAWNVSKASDIRVDEISEKKLKEALGDSYDSEDTGVLTRTAIDTGIVSSALFSAQSFLTLSQIGTSFGLSLLLNATRPDDPHFKNHTLAWMPMALAKDEEDAAKQMIKIAVESFKNMPDDHEWKIDWAKTNANMQKIGNSFLNSRYEFTLYFEGGECDVFDCMFFIYLFEPELTPKPDFINAKGEEVYHFKPDGHAFPSANVMCSYPNKIIDSLRHFKSGKPIITESSYDIKDCYNKVGKLGREWITWMPSWFYKYHRPTKTKLPYLASKEKILLYIKPDTL